MCLTSCAAVVCVLVLLPGKGGLLRECECALCRVLLSIAVGCWLFLGAFPRGKKEQNLEP
jgi:hypothetical protein